jgi:GT2 family glycosyltransferase
MNAIRSLTAAVCTHNRATLLPKLLAALESIDSPSGVHFDVLLIDNASTDSTADVINPYVTRSPLRFRYLFEETLGLSHARNRALRESRADVVAFLDDDAVPREGWLDALIDGYESGERIGAVGGPALLAFGNARLPGWFKKPLYPYFSHKEVEGESLIECRNVEDFPYGTNASFRRELAQDLGGFDIGLGRIGAKLLSGEETVLCENIQKAGYRVLMQPKAVVDHYISPRRLRLRHLFRQAWADGQVYFVWESAGKSSLSTRQVVRDTLRCLGRHRRTLMAKAREKHELVLLAYNFIVDLSTLYHRWRARDLQHP